MGVYTVHDYAAIIEHLVRTWKVDTLVVSGKAAKAQVYLCKQAERYTRLAEEIAARAEVQPTVKFSWIFDREV